ncbi:MAG: ParB/RepB/Spo0J family partition protein [Paracoccus sp. (in: a-proteobacteria)]|uniref:ParB/RepB/Spo0J family partition protein n=1 Tax=Paracoccus sp. TaxID=267 RepID=UPI0026E019F5|nr:ParB/RepB/Spo0J family partition protein [Paracoccus sp. (in: a-proteobacteria)]MDO5621648.1 ParB/RepB/Spo0J family partition protein [Paracoccus sp. (in: a-proteobacteria)]
MTKDNRKDKRALGRGLSVLMADVDLIPDVQAARRDKLPIEQILPNPDQPRREYDPEQLQELASSLRHKGVLQPLIVRPHPTDEGLFQIVAGERRWRAAQLAQLHELPVIIRELDDLEVLEIAIIENIQRADLNAIEEAASYRQLMDRFGHTQEKLAEGLNKSRSHIANLLRLLNLPNQVQGWVKDGNLSTGHARALITATDPTALARKVIEKKLSVRQTEDLVRKQAEPTQSKQRKSPMQEDADTRQLSADLSAQIKMQVRIRHAGQDGGEVTIRYRNLDELDKLCQALGG